MFDLSIKGRAIARSIPNALPLAKMLVEAAKKQGASVDDMLAAIFLVQEEVEREGKKILLSSLFCK